MQTSPITPNSSAPDVSDPQHYQSPSTNRHYSTYRSTMPNRKVQRARTLANTLGWLSIGLGLVQVLAPRAVSRAIGVSSHPVLLRTIGAREIASGVGILSQTKPTGWLWSRVAGDAMDLALLGVAAASTRHRRSRIAIVTGAVAGLAVFDMFSSVKHRQLDRTGLLPVDDSGPVHVEKCITVNRSADECYRFWRDFENFPRFMKHLESVKVTDGNRSHWIAKGPAGTRMEWDAEVTADQEGELLAWSSIGGADVENAGTVRFERAPGDRGTIIWVDLDYRPPGGKAGTWLARMFGEEPSQQIDEDLRRFKWLIETGEIPTNIGQASGRRDMVSRLFFRKGAPG
jgi:uncharacterized membrane protein